MRETRFLRQGYWPITEMPEDLHAYFAFRCLFAYPNFRMCIDSCQAFENTLKTDSRFASFWELYREEHPEKTQQFWSSIEESLPVEFRRIEQEFHRYQFDLHFKMLMEDHRRELVAEFEAMRLDSDEDILKAEAIRLNCADSEVRPSCPVLEFTPNADGVESRFTDLPDAIFVKIMNCLDTMDVFRVSLVCQKWKNMLYVNPGLKRAEHAKTTHLLTFKDWKNSARTQSMVTLERRYHSFSFGLVNWCCRVTDHLETVILPSVEDFPTLVTLLQSCPNLKNLQIGYKHDYCLPIPGEPYCTVLRLPDLEFYCSYLSSSDLITGLNTDILVSCESLRYFGGQLELLQIPELDVQNRIQCAFQNLIALDLACFSVNVLYILADAENLQLRYFRLGRLELFTPEYQNTQEADIRAAECLKKIVTNLKTLEIFIAMDTLRLGASTIKLITQTKLNLKFAAFAQFSSFYDEDGGEQWTADILDEFGKMLLSNDPNLDLSQFTLAVYNKREYQDIIDRNIGFTLIYTQDVYKLAWHDFTLNNLDIKRRLGLMF